MYYTELFLLQIDPGHLSAHKIEQQNKNIRSLVLHIPKYFTNYGIDTNKRQAHFLGQIYVESDHFSSTEENVNYSERGFKKTFPKHASEYNHWRKVEENCVIAPQFINKGKLAANTAYSKRNGNDDYMSGDGYRYRGRGFMQVTGKDNYSGVASDINVDVVNNPDLLSDPQYALLSACSFWNKNHLNSLADKDDFVGLTRKINGGLKKLSERKLYTQKIESMQPVFSGPTTNV